MWVTKVVDIEKIMADDTEPMEFATREDIVENFQVPKQSYVSCITANEVESASCKEEGNYYIITIKVKDQKNPVIGKGTEVRPGAYIRGAALIGEGVVVGNSTEIKNAIIFDGVQIPHYNYVGDSILGYKSHMGAGAIASNFKLDHSNITLRAGEDTLDTGLRKFGAILGDFAEVGCGSVLCPGTVTGRESLIYPLCRVRVTIPHRKIFDGEILKERK
jgi:NDP-sugar pyrophosphorylase family protein